MVKSERSFRTISEASLEVGESSHVLRFWEKKFHQIRPVKGSGGRRYYRYKDIALIKAIRVMIRLQKLSFEDVKDILRREGVKKAIADTESLINHSDILKYDDEDHSYVKRDSDNFIISSDTSKNIDDNIALRCSADMTLSEIINVLCQVVLARGSDNNIVLCALKDHMLYIEQKLTEYYLKNFYQDN